MDGEKYGLTGCEMKYMTFNSSCSYAGVANMLEQYGVDTEAESDAVFGVASAVLDYLDAHPEYSDDAAVQTHLSDENTVWWTQGGSVWHVTSDCSALAKSKSLQNGSEADAAAAGKSRVCKRCGS